MRWDLVLAGGLIAVGLVANGFLTRFTVGGGGADGSTVWVVDGLTGQARLCFLSIGQAARLATIKPVEWGQTSGCVESGAMR